jgi:hypothetical protein
MTAVEWLVTEIAIKNNDINFDFWAAVEQAKEMELKEKAKKKLFIGKVSEIIGAYKTIELLKEVNNEIK